MPTKILHQIHFKYLIFSLLFIFNAVNNAILSTANTINAAACPDLRIIFARGSGGILNEDPNYLEYKSTIENKLQTTNLTYEFIDLDYPAVAVGLDNFGVSLGALISGGDAYEFGASVNSGVLKLTNLVNNSSCTNTKYVIGGYSQGAMVVSKSLSSLKSDKIIYAATFGDPKIYLPEGEGLYPAACKNQNLSDYRAYVPDCQAYKGLLGSYEPYQPLSFIGKLGTWCNKSDIFCSSHLSLNDHLAYISDSLYEDASRVIFDKITAHFNLDNTVTSPHDTAILIDTTSSMGELIEKYKMEAFMLARQTLENDGRVALYEYRDLADPFEPVKHCDFDTCNLDVIITKLDSIRTNGGGDTPESLLSATFHVMTDLQWHYGATKSLVIITDADFLSPDRDGITFEEVVNLSRSIDPVNFYILTTSEYADFYQDLATATDGLALADFDAINGSLTNFVMSRYDSLPHAELQNSPIIKPTLTITDSHILPDQKYQISFTANTTKTLLILNDQILGYTTDSTITLTNLDFSIENIITLVPLGDNIRGESTSITLPPLSSTSTDDSTTEDITPIITPKTPNTGFFTKNVI